MLHHSCDRPHIVPRSANPPQYEEKIRENQRQDPKFAFFDPADPFQAHYRHRMGVVRGEFEESPVREGEKEERPVETAPVDRGGEPPIPKSGHREHTEHHGYRPVRISARVGQGSRFRSSLTESTPSSLGTSSS